MKLNVNLPEKSQIVKVLLKCGYKINTSENHIDGFKSLDRGYFPRFHVRVEKQGRGESWKGSSYNLHIDLEKPKHSQFWGKCFISTNDEIKKEIKLLKQIQAELLREIQSKGLLLTEKNGPIKQLSKKETNEKIKQLNVSFCTVKRTKCPKIDISSQDRVKKVIRYVSSNLEIIRKDMHIIPPFNKTLTNIIKNSNHLLLAADKYNSYLIYVRQYKGRLDPIRKSVYNKLKYYKVIIDPSLENRKFRYLGVLYNYPEGELSVERMYNLNR